MMGYRTIQRVPNHVLTYEHAKRIHDKIKPIRGSDNVRPLGARRDHGQYKVRMKDSDIEFVCYNTPVITYHVEGTVTVRTGGYATATTNEFIHHILGLKAKTNQGYTLIETRPKSVCMDGGSAVKVRMVGSAYSCVWEIVETDEAQAVHTALCVDRKAANNVRARYKDFMVYLKGFCKLSTKTEEGSRYRYDDKLGRPIQEQVYYDVLQIPVAMALAAWPEWEVEDKYHLAKPASQPPMRCAWRGYRALMNDNYTHHAQYVQEMMELVLSGDPEKYFKAAVWLCSEMDSSWNPEGMLKLMATDKPVQVFNEFILCHHALEVLKPTEGKGSGKYMHWYLQAQRKAAKEAETKD